MIKKDKHIVFQQRIQHELPARYGITPTNELAKEWGVSPFTIYEYGRRLKLGRQRVWRYRGAVIIRNAITQTEYERVPFNGIAERKRITVELSERYNVGFITGRFELSIEVK